MLEGNSNRVINQRQPARGRSSQESLKRLNSFTQRRINNLKAIADQFRSHSESWYMPATESTSGTN